MSKRSLEANKEGGIDFSELPSEVVSQIYTSYPLSDPGSICSILLLNKESFTLVKPWCLQFLGVIPFAKDEKALAFSLTRLYQTIKEKDDINSKKKILIFIIEKKCQEH